MRRPLFLVSACLVILTAIRLNAGWPGENEACAPGGVYDGTVVHIIGQVYQKDEESVYIKDVVLKSGNPIESTNSKQSAADSRQSFSNIICEVNSKEFLWGRKLSAEEIPLGSKVEISGTFMPFSGANNPGEFDARVYYRSMGICGKLRETEVLAVGKEYWKIREWLFDLNSQLSKRLYIALPEEYASIMEAMLLGEQGNINRDIKDLYRRNGILHILSISGMHVSIVGMSINKFLRRLGVPMQLSAIGGGVFLLAYGALTGFGLSAVRAIGMYLVRMLGEVVGRTYDMLTAVGLVGCIMVLWNPYYLQNSGFLLSFSCVLGIGILYPLLLPELKRYQGNNRPAVTIPKKVGEFIRQAEVPRKTMESFYLSLSVTLATLPVQLCLYYEVPVFSILLNLLIVPFVEPLMMSGIITMIIPENIVFEAIVCIVFEAYEFVCRCFDRIPFQTWNPGCPQIWQVVAYYGVLALVLWWRLREKGADDAGDEGTAGRHGSAGDGGAAERYGSAGDEGAAERHGSTGSSRKCRVVVRVTLLGAAVFVLGFHPHIDSTVSFLDVGQGSCALIQLSSGENYLFDCGSTNRSKVGQYSLLPYLKHQGIRTLDGVFVSHPDTDHVNGILELLELGEDNDIVIRQLILPDVAENARKEEFGRLWSAAEKSGTAEGSQETAIRYLSTGDTWECDGARFLCLHPDEGYSAEDSNQYSQCVLVEFLENGKAVAALLLTGDVGGEGEADFIRALEKFGRGDITVYQCAHHGSKYSNSEALLEILRPEVTVVSAGKNNSYGHPHPETLDRLGTVRSRVFSTMDCGMVRVKMGKRVSVYRFRR